MNPIKDKKIVNIPNAINAPKSEMNMLKILKVKKEGVVGNGCCEYNGINLIAMVINIAKSKMIALFNFFLDSML